MLAIFWLAFELQTKKCVAEGLNIDIGPKSEWETNANYKCLKEFCKDKDYKKSAPIIDNSIVHTNLVWSYENQTRTSEILKRIEVHKMLLTMDTWLVTVWKDHHLRAKNDSQIKLLPLDENVIKEIWTPILKLKGTMRKNINMRCKQYPKTFFLSRIHQHIDFCLPSEGHKQLLLLLLLLKASTYANLKFGIPYTCLVLLDTFKNILQFFDNSKILSLRSNFQIFSNFLKI